MKLPETTQIKDNANGNEGGKARIQEKFLGANPFRRFGNVTATPNLKVLVNAEGRRTVTWARQVNQVDKDEEGLNSHKLGQVIKPITLARVEPEETFSGPSTFEWGESSTKVHKPKYIWVTKRAPGGPTKEHVMTHSIKATNDPVEVMNNTTNDHDELMDNSGVFSLELMPTPAVFVQELTSLKFRMNSEGVFRSIRLEYYGGFNFSVPRNIAGNWRIRPKEASTFPLLGDSTSAWANDVEEAESGPHMESHCLAVVLCDIPEGSTEEISLDISPLNSYRGESIQGGQSEWVRQNMEAFNKQMGVSIEGCELEAMALFTAIEQRWRQPGVSRPQKCKNQSKARKRVRESKNLSTSVNYGASLTQDSGRRSRGLVYSQCI